MTQDATDGLPIAVEDRFVVISLSESSYYRESNDMAEVLGQALRYNQVIWQDAVTVIDLRNIKHLYSDIEEFIDALDSDTTHVMIDRDDDEADERLRLSEKGYEVLRVDHFAQPRKK